MIKSHICKVPSAYTCLECNMTCEEAKLGQTIFIFTVLAATLRLVWGCCCFCCFVKFDLLQDRNYSSWQGNHVENLCSDGLILCGDDTVIMTVTLSQWLINNWFTRWICNVVMMVLSTGTKTTTFFCHKIFRWYFCIFTLLYFKGFKTFIGMWSLCECLIQVRDTWSEAPA